MYEYRPELKSEEKFPIQLRYRGKAKAETDSRNDK